jgi:hypothetical protein
MSPHLYKSVPPTVKKIMYAQSRQAIYRFAFHWYRSFGGFPKNMGNRERTDRALENVVNGVTSG